MRRQRRAGGPGSGGDAAPKPRGAFEIACRYLTTRERCAAQVRRYLERQAFSADEIAEAIRLLREKRFVDDLRYARAYAEVRSRRAPRSGAWLVREIVMRGVDRETAQRAVDEFLRETPEDDLARRLLGRMAGERGPDLAERAARRLRSRGFRPAIAIAWAKEQEGAKRPERDVDRERTRERGRWQAGRSGKDAQTPDEDIDDAQAPDDGKTKDAQTPDDDEDLVE